MSVSTDEAQLPTKALDSCDPRPAGLAVAVLLAVAAPPLLPAENTDGSLVRMEAGASGFVIMSTEDTEEREASESRETSRFRRDPNELMVSDVLKVWLMKISPDNRNYIW